MAPLTFYLDDSGTHADTATVVVGAWVASYPNWMRLIREWNKAKLEYGFKVMHMAEMMANNPKSEFADKTKWNEARKRATVHRLREIIRQNALHGFSMSVARAAYDESLTGNFREQVGRHFTYAVRCAIGFTQEWRRKNGINEATEFIFDAADKAQRREIDGIFDGMLQDEDCFEKYGAKSDCHSFRDKTEMLPLQAADLLAYCVFQGDKERFGLPLNPLPVETLNFFIRQRDFLTAKYQTSEAIAAIGVGNPRLKYSEDRRPKPTPKGTRPIPK